MAVHRAGRPGFEQGRGAKIKVSDDQKKILILNFNLKTRPRPLPTFRMIPSRDRLCIFSILKISYFYFVICGHFKSTLHHFQAVFDFKLQDFGFHAQYYTSQRLYHLS
jgi:hypothetical protein